MPPRYDRLLQSPKSHSFFHFPDLLTFMWVWATELKPIESEGIGCRPLPAGSNHLCLLLHSSPFCPDRTAVPRMTWEHHVGDDRAAIHTLSKRVDQPSSSKSRMAQCSVNSFNLTRWHFVRRLSGENSRWAFQSIACVCMHAARGKPTLSWQAASVS